MCRVVCRLFSFALIWFLAGSSLSADSPEVQASSGTSHILFEEILKSSLGIHYTRQINGVKYAIVIKRRGVGFMAELFVKEGESIERYAGAFIREEDARRRVELLENGRVNFNIVPPDSDHIWFTFEERVSESAGRQEIGLKFNQEGLVGAEFPGVSSFVQINRFRPLQINSGNRFRSQRSLTGQRDLMKVLADFLSQNEGAIGAKSQNFEDLNLSIESVGVFAGYEIRIDVENRGSGIAYISSTSEFTDWLNKPFKLDGRNELSIRLTGGELRGHIVVMTVNPEGYISRFRVAQEGSRTAQFRCSTVYGRVAFKHPFH